LRGVQTGTDIDFGDLLRRHRATAGVTQEDLASRTGLTPQAIGLLERGKRRHPHAYTVQKLAEALELDGPDLSGFEAAARRSTTARSRDDTSVYRVPAPPTSLVGREYEVETIATLLRKEDVRLMTLIGPGGVGKTRLAIEVARRSREAFADGVVFVPLAPLRDPELVPSVLAETLGVKDVADRPLQDALQRYLQGKEMLLLVDNTEHLLPAAPVVADLVEACPRLTVLATSRAPLRLSAEQQFPIAPLSLDEAAYPARSPAVRLYLERARAVAPAFELTDANAATVARICQRLDGLPLAIELAAARVKLFSPQALLERLDPGLSMLSGGARDLPERQQTLRDTVAWSYDLLGPAERTVFGRLSVFAGGLTLDAAEVICEPGMPDAGGLLEVLASLVDNSLLVSNAGTTAQPGGNEPRFTMLETIREFAAERLGSGGDAEEVHRAHATYYLALAEAAQPEVSDLMLGGWLEVLEREHENLRVALRWAIRRRDVDFGARLALSMWRFWPERHHVTEGRRWLESVLALGQPASGVEEPTLSARRWAFLHLVTGMLASGQGDYDRAVELYEESLALYRNMGHMKGASGPLRELGVAAYHQGDYDRAALLSEQALAISRESGSVFGSGLAVCTLADALRAQGDIERARTLLEESLDSLRHETYPLRVANAVAITLARLGSIECELGRDVRALGLHKESLSLSRHYGFTFEVFFCLEGLARIEAIQGRPERAARLLGTSAAQREDVGSRLTRITRADYDNAVTLARAALGDDAFEVAWNEGRETSLDETISEALGTDT
jgi:predicted ATPase/tetratricopeptide (TPR) repeat protein/DNA-binding XRE family transcriptional regulator